MFGTYRTLLALSVVFFHIGYLPRLGAYAVFGFYVLSGYLMTLVMHESYGYTLAGVGRFVLNRILRIYPIYWLACLLAILIIALVGPDIAARFHEALVIPREAKSILQNVFLIFPNLDTPRLTPPSWALTVELFYYGCIGLGVSRNKLFAWAWFGLAIIYHVYVTVAGWGPSNLYFPIPAAALPFSIGALISLYRDRLLGSHPILNVPLAPHFLFVLVFVNWAVGFSPALPERPIFYLNMILNALLVLSLSLRRTLVGISTRTDRLMGGLSYPIYLIHYQVGLVTFAGMSALGFHVRRGDNALALASLPLLIFLAWLLSTLVEKPIDKIRRKIRA